jgi:FkbM family methyltransferase
MVQVQVNGRWPLWLPRDRARREGWAWWERDALAALWSVIRPGDTVWDIGAEQGDLAALYATWGAEVIAVEPDPGCWPLIRATFDANSIEPERGIEAAVGPTARGTNAFAHEDTWPDSAWDPEPPEPAFVTDPPEVVTLDQIMDFVGLAPDLVVMDIEGGEYQALLGGEHLLRTLPILMISVHPEMMRDRYGDTPDDLIAHVERQGYTHHRVSYDHEHHYLFKPDPGRHP